MAFEALEGELGLDKSEFTRGLADASKETIAFGQVAEGTFEDVGDEASEAGAEAAASSEGFEALAESIGDAVLPARLTASAVDEAGDEASEAGAKAYAATTGFAALQLSTTGLSMSMGALTTVGTSTAIMLGTVAIAAGALATAMLPVIIGAGAIAAAFGVIVGSGIYAGMSQLQSAFKSARKQIEPMARELGSRFVPFLKETIGMLPGLVSNIITAIGPLDQFLAALRSLRTAAFSLLPQLVSWFFDLGRWALPIVSSLARIVRDVLAPAFARIVTRGKRLWTMFSSLAGSAGGVTIQLRGLWTWIQSLVGVFQRSAAAGTPLRQEISQMAAAARRFVASAQPTVTSLRGMVTQLIRAAPVVAKVATDILTLAINIGTRLLPVVNSLIQFVSGVVRWFNGLSGGMQRAIVSAGALVLALGPIISIISTIISVVGTVISFGSTLIGVIGTIITVATTLIGALGTFVSILATVGSALVTVVTFFNPISLAIAALVAAVVGLYLAFQNNLFGIRDITNRVLNTVTTMMSDAASWISSTGRSLWADSFGALADAAIAAYNSIMPDRLGIPEITIPRVEFSIPGLTVAGHEVYDSQSVGVGPFGPFGGQSVGIPQLASGGFIESEGLAMLHEGEQVVPAAQVDRGGGGGPQQMIVQLDADAVLELMRGEAVNVFDERVQSTERKKRRRGTR